MQAPFMFQARFTAALSMQLPLLAAPSARGNSNIFTVPSFAIAFAFTIVSAPHSAGTVLLSRLLAYYCRSSDLLRGRFPSKQP